MGGTTHRRPLLTLRWVHNTSNHTAYVFIFASLMFQEGGGCQNCSREENATLHKRLPTRKLRYNALRQASWCLNLDLFDLNLLVHINNKAKGGEAGRCGR